MYTICVFLCYNAIENIGDNMLKIILDTNLFRHRELQGLEDYTFSALFEKINELIKKGIIQDVQLCMNETALFEYVKQMANDYQTMVVDAYTKAYKIMKDSLPVLKVDFRSKKDFAEEYYIGLLNRLEDLKIEIIKTLPRRQEGGMILEDVMLKTINNQPPFDKEHNKNLKDAFISETNNSESKRDGVNTYVYITNNYKDFESNKVKTDLYYIVGINPVHQETSDRLIYVMKTIMDFGSHVDEEVFCKELAYCKFVRDDIKLFLEMQIIEGQFYNNIPQIKKCDDVHYQIEYEKLDDCLIDIKFIIIDGENEHCCGIVYDYSKAIIEIREKYIRYTDDNEEEVYFNEF